MSAVATKLPKDFFELVSNDTDKPDSPLLRLSFPYGANIIDGGRYSVIDCLDKTTQGSYFKTSELPVAINTSKNIEEYSHVDKHCIAQGVLDEGTFFGNSKELYINRGNLNFSNYFCAGVKDIFMLPKISENKANQRLFAKYDITTPQAPVSYDQHYQTFYNITRHNPDVIWKSELIIFSKEWHDYFASSKDIQNYFLKLNFRESLARSFHTKFQLLWQYFMLCAEKRNLTSTLSPHISNIIKHLLLIALGAAPGFAPAIDDIQAPVSALQRAYIDDYEIDTIPTVMALQFYNTEKKVPVYYSLQKLEASMSSTIYPRRSAIQDLIIIKNALYAFSEMLEKQNHETLSMLKNVRFDFFHTEPKGHTDIKPVSCLINEDKRFETLLVKQTKKRPVAVNASFFRGCIRIHKT